MIRRFAVAGFVTVLALAVSGIFGVVSVRRYLAAAHMNARRALAPSNVSVPTRNLQTAFTHNLIAWRHWPYSTIIRQQLFLSLVRWQDSSRRIRIHPKSVDRIYGISTSASPHTPALKILRISNLLSSGRIGDGKEIEKMLANLKRTSWLMPEVWLIEAEYAAYRRDWVRFERAMLKITKNDRRKQFAGLVVNLRKMSRKLRSRRK